MGLPETPSPPHLYPQALQLKLYQAFIFSIPILFSIILFLLFYLFYLKRRASSLSSPPPLLPRSLNQATSFAQSPCQMGLKAKVIEKLPKVLFDEDLGARDSQCCVCLGEFEIKEELIQVPACKHVFHVDCIQHWFRSNSTCPLCRCLVISSTKLANNNNPQPPASTVSAEPLHQNTNQNPNSANADLLREEQVIQVEGMSSSGSTYIRDLGRCTDSSRCMENNNVNNVGYQDGQEVVLHIQTHIS